MILSYFLICALGVKKYNKEKDMKKEKEETDIRKEEPQKH